MRIRSSDSQFNVFAQRRIHTRACEFGVMYSVLKIILYYHKGGERDSMQGGYPRVPRHVQYARGSGTGYGNRSGHSDSRSPREGPNSEVGTGQLSGKGSASGKVLAKGLPEETTSTGGLACSTVCVAALFESTSSVSSTRSKRRPAACKGGVHR